MAGAKGIVGALRPLGEAWGGQAREVDSGGSREVKVGLACPFTRHDTPPPK